MRLHSLTVSAFGSFSDRATVDFDQLSETGLFLLHGPTGAGKTTILDAVSFALFGTVPGVRTAGEALRSHHASADTVTEVELEVTLDGQRYRIVRRPKQQRPKQRGEGLREHPSYATVEELVAGAWVIRAAKPNEADPYLQDHLHMEADQFHQIVMLPQGDFARFLRANADERRQALEELFGTHRFTEVERWLRNQADTARTAVREADEQVRRSLVAAATVGESEPFADDARLSEASTWMTTLVAAARQQARHAAAAEQQHRAAHDQARRAAAAAVDLHARRQRHAAAQADQHRLADEAAEQVRRRDRRDEAHRAASIVPLIALAQQAADELQVATRRLDRSRRALAGVAPHLGDASAEHLVVRDEVLIGDLTTIGHLFDDEQSLEAREHERADLDDRLAHLVEQRDLVSQAALALPAERADLDERTGAAREAAGRLDDLAQLEVQLSARHAAAAERDRLGSAVAEQGVVVTDRRADALDRREHWLTLLQHQLSNQAAALAADLEQGDPCPVCGSAEHPLLASGDAPIVTDEDVAAARERSEQAEHTALRASETATELGQHLAAAVAVAGDTPTDELLVDLTELGLAVGRARAAAASLAQLDERRTELEGRSEAMAELLATADEEVADTTAARQQMDVDLEAHRLRIAKARAGFDNLHARAEALQAERLAIGAVLDAGQVHDQAVERSSAARVAAESEAARRSFADVAEAQAASLDDHTLAGLVAAIEDHDRSVAETEAILADPTLVAAAAAPPIDLELVQHAAHAAERDWDLASTAAATTRTAVDKLERAQVDIEERLVGLAPLSDAYDRARHLADLACGDDRQVEHRMRLSTYVLAARLEQVAAAASERLSRMSGGRFTIVHTDEAPDGRRKGGLGLRVVDAWTSTERETASLSGGESFFTSLALALGVADVVSAEAGGIKIDTMFIDEGFGSLDEDTLQQVLDVIDGLRAGGRTIGIVSHVADLRDRITTQLEVIKGPNGSSLRTSTVSPDALADPRFDRSSSTGVPPRSTEVAGPSSASDAA